MHTNETELNLSSIPRFDNSPARSHSLTISNRLSLKREDPLRRSTHDPLTVTYSLPVKVSLPVMIKEEEVKLRPKRPRFSRRNSSKNSLLIAEKAKDITMDGILMPGECVVAQVDEVRHVTPYRQKDSTGVQQRIRGTLFATNFRLIFISSEGICPVSLQLSSENYWANIPEYFSLPQGNIHAILTLVNGTTEYKQLNKNTKVLRLPDEIRINCKDSKRVKFIVSSSPPGQVKQFLQGTMYHMKPRDVTKLFAVDLGRHWNPATVPRGELKVPSYEEISNWENEVQRLKLNNWRVSGVNSKFQLSGTLPPYIMCPLMVSDKLLTQTGLMYRLGRLPTLSYSTPRGYILMRSSYLLAEHTGATPVIVPVVEHNYVSSCLPPESSSPMDSQERTEYLRIDLGQELPSLQQIQLSYSRMMEAVHEEERWLSCVENTRWLEVVSSCLTVARHVVDLLKKQSRHVLILEPEGRDLTALVATLVQLISDPESRTLIGFESLIQREWVAYGHPFCTRLSHTSVSREEEETTGFCPVFLLMLDCCWQIIRQFPTTFEFNSQYLLMMAQELCSCVSSTFLFDSIQHKQESLLELEENNHSTFLYTFWQLRRLVYPTEQTETALNPLYCLRQALMSNREMFSLIEESLEKFSKQKTQGRGLGRSMSLHSISLQSPRKGSIIGSRSTNLINKAIITALAENVLFKPLEDTLEPKVDLTHIQVWKDFFVSTKWDTEGYDQSYTCMVERELQKLVKQIFNLYHTASEVQSILDISMPEITFSLEGDNLSTCNTSLKKEPSFQDIYSDTLSNSPSIQTPDMTRSCTLSSIPPTAPFIKPNTPQIMLDKDMTRLHSISRLNNREKTCYKIPIVSVSECAEALYILKQDMTEMEVLCLDMKITKEEYGEV